MGPDTLRFTALQDTTGISARNGDGNAVDVQLDSRDPEVAEIVSGNRVVALGAGSTWVVGTFGELSDSVPVVVTQVPVGLGLSAEPDTLVAGDTAALTATAVDARGHIVAGAEPVWHFPDTSAIGIADDLAIGRKAGTFVLEARLDTLAERLPVTVLAGGAASITLAEDTLRLVAVGQTTQVQATLEDEAGNDLPASAAQWTTGDTAVAVSTGSGRVEATGPGATWLVASGEGVADSARVLVTQVAASIAVLPAEDTLNALGDTVQLSATVYDYLGEPVDGVDVEWEALDGAIASVDEDGQVVSHATGRAAVRVRMAALTDTAHIASRQIAATVELGPDTAALDTGESLRVLRAVSDSNDVEIPDSVLVWEAEESGVEVDTTGMVGSATAASGWVRAAAHEVVDSVFVAVASDGVHRTWIGGHPEADDEFESPYNWRHAGGPNPQDTVAIPAAGTPVVRLGLSVTRLEVESGAAMDLEEDLSITGSVESDGTYTGAGGFLVEGPQVALVGTTPRLVITGAAIVATDPVTIRGRAQVDAGQLQSDGQLIQIENPS